MKKIATCILVKLLIITACQKKSLPVITERSPSISMRGNDTTTMTPDTLRGRIVMTNRCGRCHDRPEPQQFTAKRWSSIISLMAPRARLNRQNELNVLAYVTVNAGN